MPDESGLAAGWPKVNDGLMNSAAGRTRTAERTLCIGAGAELTIDWIGPELTMGSATAWVILELAGELAGVEW